MPTQKPKTLARLLDKVIPKYGCIISPQLHQYFSDTPNLTAEQFAVMLMADDSKDILLNWDFKKQLEQDFIHYFGENSITNHDY